MSYELYSKFNPLVNGANAKFFKIGQDFSDFDRLQSLNMGTFLRHSVYHTDSRNVQQSSTDGILFHFFALFCLPSLRE